MKKDKVLFEWDTEKEKINIHKHGISFDVAKLVFNDYNRIEMYQYKNGEDRYITIGVVDEILVVVYTMRRSVYRIISARNANNEEKRLYYGY